MAIIITSIREAKSISVPNGHLVIHVFALLLHKSLRGWSDISIFNRQLWLLEAILSIN